jgi:hypothetical protein
MWREERLWNVGVLQRVHLSRLVLFSLSMQTLDSQTVSQLVSDMTICLFDRFFIDSWVL